MSQDSCDDEDPGTDLPSPSIETPCTRPSAHISQDNQQPSKSPFWNRLTFWNVLFNFILAIITVCLGFIAYWQLEATNSAIGIATSANKISTESLRVSQESYTVSERALQFSQESVRLDQRAWVGPSNVQMVRFEVGKTIQTEVIVTNTGKTPAREMQVWHIMLRYSKPFDLDKWDFDTSAKKLDIHPTITTLFPNGSRHVPSETSYLLSQDEFLQIMANTVDFYIVAKVAYADVFDKPHLTYVCAHYSPGGRNFNNCKTNRYDKAN
jgi:hypothetical protein